MAKQVQEIVKIITLLLWQKKRAIDRAVLKLLGIHGFVYSDSEMEAVEKQEEKQEKKQEEIILTDDEKNLLCFKLDEAYANGNLTETYHALKDHEKTQLRDYANELARK